MEEYKKFCDAIRNERGVATTLQRESERNLVEHLNQQRQAEIAELKDTINQFNQLLGESVETAKEDLVKLLVNHEIKMQKEFIDTDLRWSKTIEESKKAWQAEAEGLRSSLQNAASPQDMEEEENDDSSDSTRSYSSLIAAPPFAAMQKRITELTNRLHDYKMSAEESLKKEIHEREMAISNLADTLSRQRKTLAKLTTMASDSTTKTDDLKLRFQDHCTSHVISHQQHVDTVTDLTNQVTTLKSSYKDELNEVRETLSLKLDGLEEN
jgi:hypothetical protein